MERCLRLRRSNDYARLRRAGQRVRQRSLTLSFAANHLSHNRYGFVTSRKVGKAVARNRVRRLLREAVRAHHPHIQQGYDVVFVAYPDLAGQPFEVVERIIETLLDRADLLVESDLL